MGFPGGKAGAGVYQTIINQIQPHDVYIEAFLGDGAIMRRKLPAARSIGVELDRSTAAAFGGQDLDALFGGVGPEVYCCCGIEWLKHHFGLYRIAASCTAGGALSGGGIPPQHSATAAAVASSNGHGSRQPGGVAESSGLGRAHELPLTTHHSPRTFVYCDPPYLMSTRRSGKLYRFEMTRAQHVELLDVIKRLPCDVAISGYWSPLYAAALQEWRFISFHSMTRGGRKAREYVWMNYPEPTVLHDYRYLGGNKRQRERITRKVRTWSAGLRRLPALERQAIMAELSPIGPAALSCDVSRVAQDRAAPAGEKRSA